jgi:hypothetical protein
MSQHIFDARWDDVPVQIQIGWDRPLQRFYLVVSPYDADGELGDPVYSNLDEPQSRSQALDDFKKSISRLGVDLSPEMIANFFAVDSEGSDPQVVSHDEPKPTPPSLNDFISILARHGIEIPPQLASAVLADQQIDAVNRREKY